MDNRPTSNLKCIDLEFQTSSLPIGVLQYEQYSMPMPTYHGWLKVRNIITCTSIFEDCLFCIIRKREWSLRDSVIYYFIFHQKICLSLLELWEYLKLNNNWIGSSHKNRKLVFQIRLHSNKHREDLNELKIFCPLLIPCLCNIFFYHSRQTSNFVV